MTVRKSGGDPRWIGRSAGKGSGRFNARRRGAKLASSLPREGGDWKRYKGGLRYRARRVVVKVRVVKLNAGRGGNRGCSFVTSARTVDAHLRYLERGGVTRDGEKGRVTFGPRDEVLPRLMSGIRNLQEAGQKRKERAHAGSVNRT